MARPREHDVDELLDHARDLWARAGLDGLTIRALSTASGVSNGAIYHAVGSRAALIARVWSREAEGFLAHQRAILETAADPVEALVAVACTPADFARDHPEGSTVLLSVRAEDLIDDRLDIGDRERLLARRRELGAIITELAERRWNRRDRPTLALVTMCVVDLPSALLLSRGRIADPIARHALETAVRAIAAGSPPN